MPEKLEVPEPWASAMTRVGAIGPDGQPSIRRLASKADGRSVEAVRKLVHGLSGSSELTIQSVAAALNETAETVGLWASRRRPVGDPYVPPTEAALLNLRQRKALDRLIRSIVTDEEEETDAAIDEREREHARSRHEHDEAVVHIKGIAERPT